MQTLKEIARHFPAVVGAGPQIIDGGHRLTRQIGGLTQDLPAQGAAPQKGLYGFGPDHRRPDAPPGQADVFNGLIPADPHQNRQSGNGNGQGPSLSHFFVMVEVESRAFGDPDPGNNFSAFQAGLPRTRDKILNGKRRAVSRVRSTTAACKTYKGPRVSPAGEAVPILPPIVPWWRIGGEPKPLNAWMRTGNAGPREDRPTVGDGCRPPRSGSHHPGLPLP